MTAQSYVSVLAGVRASRGDDLIKSGLDIRFDGVFRSLLAQAREERNFSGLLGIFEYRQATIDNMDY